MCGICGFIPSGNNNLPPQEIITNMLDALLHRGPDNKGLFIDSGIALGTTRLSIIDLAGGDQPIHNEDKSIWITFNGEIYNYPELRESLIKKGHIFCTKTDTEVIVHLYEENGPDCLGQLNGMFAFAIWDKNKNVLFLARDRFGMKPLYYTELNGQLIFASEVKAILRFPDFKRELDLGALNKYLTFEYVPSSSCIFKKIKKLPAAHYLICENKNISTVKYWDINFTGSCKPPDEIEAKERLLQLLGAAVKRHLLSDAPLGFFLSGGIDSSAIVALASRLTGDNLKTFSIGFHEDSFDETRYAQKVARLFGTSHFHQDFEIEDLFNSLAESSNFLDEPLADVSFFPTYLLARFAKQNVKVALSGDGGDELFAGYPTYQAHKLIKYYHLIPAVIRKNLIEKIARNIPVSMKNFSLDFKIKKFVSSNYLPMALRHIYWMGAFNYEDKINLCGPLFKDLLEKESLSEEITDYLRGIKSNEELNMIQYLDIKTYLQDDLLVKTDRASMANSLEVRVPYLDRELAEFVFSLPADLRLKHFQTKYILKKSMHKILPEVIINRRKKGFGVPISFWIKGKLKPLIMDMLAKDKIKREGLFNYSYIDNLLQQHFKNKVDNRKKIWTLLMFELWLREYL